MAPQFVQPYRKKQKNDGNDAEAICEAREWNRCQEPCERPFRLGPQ